MSTKREEIKRALEEALEKEIENGATEIGALCRNRDLIMALLEAVIKEAEEPEEPEELEKLEEPEEPEELEEPENEYEYENEYENEDDPNDPLYLSSKEKKEWLIVAGIQEYEARYWAAWGLTPSDALDWRIYADAYTLGEVQAWREVGLGPRGAGWCKRWHLTPKEVAHLLWMVKYRSWFEMGFENPFQINDWIAKGFTPEEALAWVKVGVNDPHRASELASRGLTPDQYRKDR